MKFLSNFLLICELFACFLIIELYLLFGCSLMSVGSVVMSPLPLMKLVICVFVFLIKCKCRLGGELELTKIAVNKMREG